MSEDSMSPEILQTPDQIIHKDVFIGTVNQIIDANPKSDLSADLEGTLKALETHIIDNEITTHEEYYKIFMELFKITIGINQDTETNNFAVKYLQAMDNIISNRLNDLNQQTIKEKLQNLANTDPLTGLANKRLFDETIETSVKTNRKSLKPSILMIDLDHLKTINDNLGHSSGDIALKTLAQAIKGGLERDTDLAARLERDTDLAARVGGDEFIILLQNTNQEGALIVAQKIEQRLKDNQVEGIDITASIGIATLQNSLEGQEAEPIESLIKRADDALYLAKNEGKNTIRTWDQTQTT